MELGHNFKGRVRLSARVHGVRGFLNPLSRMLCARLHDRPTSWWERCQLQEGTQFRLALTMDLFAQFRLNFQISTVVMWVGWAFIHSKENWPGSWVLRLAQVKKPTLTNPLLGIREFWYSWVLRRVSSETTRSFQGDTRGIQASQTCSQNEICFFYNCSKLKATL